MTPTALPLLPAGSMAARLGGARGGGLLWGMRSPSPRPLRRCPPPSVRLPTGASFGGPGGVWGGGNGAHMPPALGGGRLRPLPPQAKRPRRRGGDGAGPTGSVSAPRPLPGSPLAAATPSSPSTSTSPPLEEGGVEKGASTMTVEEPAPTPTPALPPIPPPISPRPWGAPSPVLGLLASVVVALGETLYGFD